MRTPVDFGEWIKENQDKLKPPVNNFLVHGGSDFFVMAVGGPNARTDYHVNETEEWFYQLRGSMLLRVVEGAEDAPVFRDITIKEGEMYLHPGGVPHNPVRFADTVGLVIERTRQPHHVDRLRWYCESCRARVYEEAFHCTDIQTQLKEIILKYAGDSKLRTCTHCGHVNPAQ